MTYKIQTALAVHQLNPHHNISSLIVLAVLSLPIAQRLHPPGLNRGVQDPVGMPNSMVCGLLFFGDFHMLDNGVVASYIIV